MKNYRTTSHAYYDLKYHICWITKYRYKVLNYEKAKRTRELIMQICSANDVQVITGSISTDHIHLFLSVPPNLSVSKLTQLLKGTTSRKLQQEFPDLRKKYWGQHLWAQGYFAVTSGTVTDEMWMEYIQNQTESPDNTNFNSPGNFTITS